MVDEENWKSTWRIPITKLRDAPLAGSCGETME
jgi:hypothetical protein